MSRDAQVPSSSPAPSSRDSETTPSPPVAYENPTETALHGDRRVDPYQWLREKEAPRVRAYLEAENAYTEAVMEPTRELRSSLYDELVGRIQETDSSVPYLELGDYHYVRTEEGKQYSIYCRRRGSVEAPEEILLDLNQLAASESYMSLGYYGLTDDGRLMAYSTDVTGFREYTLYIKNLETGELLPERIEKTSDHVWAGDDRTLLYTVEDEAKRPYRVYRRVVGSAAPDELIYEESDERFRVHVWRSRSLAYVFFAAQSHTTTEVRFAPADRPEGPWSLIAPRSPDHEYDVGHRGDRFYIRTNRDGRNFSLVEAPIAAPGPDSWQTVVPHRDDVMLEWVDLFEDHYALLEREDGLPEIRVVDFASGEQHRIELPEPAYSVVPSDNRHFETHVLRFHYESLVTPASVFDYDMRTRERRLLKRAAVLGGYEPEAYQTERLHATAEDGVRVPISLVYKKGLERPAPLVLYGYGAYGISIPAGFSSGRISLLDRGVCYAIAHIRGGGELGKPWHDAGRMRNKVNTFTDFITVAEHLVATGVTGSDRLVIEGGSAGGLLMGAVVNRRPDLFHAVVSHVPFVDVLNTMLDSSLPLTVGEYEEWGNPNLEADYRHISSYCPYTNLRKGVFPNMLIKTSLNDSQVMYWEPAKYVAKLRTLKTDDNSLLLHTNLAAGHHGASGRYDYLREVAFDYAFVLTQLGLA